MERIVSQEVLDLEEQIKILSKIDGMSKNLTARYKEKDHKETQKIIRLDGRVNFNKSTLRKSFLREEFESEDLMIEAGEDWVREMMVKTNIIPPEFDYLPRPMVRGLHLLRKYTPTMRNPNKISLRYCVSYLDDDGGCRRKTFTIRESDPTGNVALEAALKFRLEFLKGKNR